MPPAASPMAAGSRWSRFSRRASCPGSKRAATAPSRPPARSAAARSSGSTGNAGCSPRARTRARTAARSLLRRSPCPSTSTPRLAPSWTPAARGRASTRCRRERGPAARRRPTRCRTPSRKPSGRWPAGRWGRPAPPPRRPGRSSTPTRSIFVETDELPASLFHVIGAEAEIAYRFGRDLPPEAGPYDREAVLAAVATMHPAIEIADTRFTVFGAVDAHSQRADQQNHGVLVIGPGLTDWRSLDPVTQPVRLTIDGSVLHDHIGGNSAVDPVRPAGLARQRGGPLPRRDQGRSGRHHRLVHRHGFRGRADADRGGVPGAGERGAGDRVSVPG